MGRDDVPADLFLLALPHMLPAVTHIYNLSILNAEFPSIWKVSKICPLFKGGDPGSREGPKNYRLVALLPIGARLLEKIVCEQVMEFLYSRKLLHSRNHGYREHHGTVTAVLEAQEEALEVIYNGEIVRMIALDQSAAFDVIEHSILRRKMELYGFDPHSLSWFCSYMKDRSQYVYLETSVPEVKVVRPFACPKGSCLGPLLWNLYCGEVSEIKPLSTHVAGEEEIIRGGRKR